MPACWRDCETLDDLAAIARDFRAAHGHRLRIATKYHRLVRAFLSAHEVADYQLVDSQGATEGTVANLDTAALVEASRRVALVAERNTALRMVFTDGQVTLDAGTGDDASANESVPCTLEGEDITVAFNPSYLSEGLAVVDQPQVRFAFTSAPKPALLTGVNQEDGVVSDYRYLVMPVRIA